MYFVRVFALTIFSIAFLAACGSSRTAVTQSDDQAAAAKTTKYPQRLARLIEAEARQGEDIYTPTEMLSDLRQGVWGELEDGGAIDPYRRNLPRAYIEQLESLMTEEVKSPSARIREFMGFTPVDVSQSDIRAYVRGQLRAVQNAAQSSIAQTDDVATELHLRDIVARIEEFLEPSEG